MKYRLYNYDLWGNEEDGYDVNDVFASDKTIDIGPNDYDETIIKKLRAEMTVRQRKRHRPKDFRIEGGDTPECFIWITHKDVPFCELRPEGEEEEDYNKQNEINIFEGNYMLDATCAVLLMVEYGWVLRDYNADDIVRLVWWNRRCSCFHWNQGGHYHGIYGGTGRTATFFNMRPYFTLCPEFPYNRRWEALYMRSNHVPDEGILELFAGFHEDDVAQKKWWHNGRIGGNRLQLTGNSITLEDSRSDYCYQANNGPGCSDYKQGHCMPRTCLGRDNWDGKRG